MKRNGKTQSAIVVSTLAMLALLTACGGGGGSTSTPTDPIVKTCANGANDYPTCKFFAADLQLTVPTPPFSAGSDDMLAFDYLNNERSLSGLGKLAYNAELTKAAAAHANYYFLNKDKAALDPHIEVTSYPGFSGVTPTDRARVAGYTVGASGSVSEGSGQVNTKLELMQNLINSIYHRSTIFNQSWRDIGFASQCVDAVCNSNNGYYGVVNYGYKTKQRNDSNFIFIYPRDGQTSVKPIFCGEFPWPFSDVPFGQVCEISSNPSPGIRYSKGAGYPISISVVDGKLISINTYSITEKGSTTQLDAWLLTSQNDANRIISSNEAYLISKTAFKLSTAYVVSVSGTSDGAPFSRVWSFTTGNAQY